MISPATTKLMFEVETRSDYIIVSMFDQEFYYTKSLSHINISSLLKKNNKTMLQWLSEERTLTILDEFGNRTRDDDAVGEDAPYITIEDSDPLIAGIYLNTLLLNNFLEWLPDSTHAKVHAMVLVYQINYALIKYRDIVNSCTTQILLNSTRLSAGECEEALTSDETICKELMNAEALTHSIFRYLGEISTFIQTYPHTDLEILSILRILNDLALDAATLSRDLLSITVNTIDFIVVASRACATYNIGIPEINITVENLKEREDELNQTIFKALALVEECNGKDCANIKTVLRYLYSIS